MKKLITTLLAIVIAMYGYAQTNTFPSSGNVGIGTTNPQSTLDIVGELRTTNSGSNSYWAYMKANWAENNVFELGISGHKLLTSDNYYFGSTLNFWTANTKQMTINAIGNVGIGTTTPDAKLTVAGKIHSQEVKVTIDAGADFVFQDDYKLKPLTEVANFISEHKHLPEIASANEMKKNGLELGEMNIKLLQKIEELTLYMIDLNKKIELLQLENENLKSKVAQLE